MTHSHIRLGTTAYERRAPAPELVRAALTGTRREVFWLADAANRSEHAPLVGHATADLTIVGGGYAGLWTAVLAKQRDPGRRVVLLEAHTIGWAASGRNGGFCEASLTHGEPNGRARWPDEYDVLERLGNENLDAFERDVADLGLDCQFERNGFLAVAVEPHQVQWARAEGPDSFLDADATRARINSPLFLAGSFERHTNALVHPAKLAFELARAAADLGVEIHEHSPVQELRRASGAVVVHTAQGRVRSDQVALGTNVFPSLVKHTRMLTVPVYDHVLMTEPLSSEQLASTGWTGREGFGDLANQFHYSRLSADNRILWGGYDANHHFGRAVRQRYEDYQPTYHRLASHFFATFPQLEGLKFSHAWAGAIDTSTQFCAFHGLAHGGRVAYTAGFTGLGVGATRFAAEVMLDRLAGIDNERTRLAMVRRKPLPFPPEPLAWVAITATRWSLDRADHREGERNLFLRTLDRVGLGFDS